MRACLIALVMILAAAPCSAQTMRPGEIQWHAYERYYKAKNWPAARRALDQAVDLNEARAMLEKAWYVSAEDADWKGHGKLLGYPIDYIAAYRLFKRCAIMPVNGGQMIAVNGATSKATCQTSYNIYLKQQIAQCDSDRPSPRRRSQLQFEAYACLLQYGYNADARTQLEAAALTGEASALFELYTIYTYRDSNLRGTLGYPYSPQKGAAYIDRCLGGRALGLSNRHANGKTWLQVCREERQAIAEARSGRGPGTTKPDPDQRHRNERRRQDDWLQDRGM